MSFSVTDQGIPDAADQQIKSLAPSGLQAIAFTPSDGWVVVANGGHHAQGIPDECSQKLGELIQAGEVIRDIAFPPAGGNSWLIVTDKTISARNIPDACYAELGTLWKAGARPTCVAFPPSGGDSWVILAGKSLYARNIDDECFQRLVNYSQGLRPAQWVSFTPTGGWVILAHDRFFARNIPDACYAQIKQLSETFEVDRVQFTQSGGWSITSNTPKQSYTQDLLRTFEEQFIQVDGTWQGLEQRMAYYSVPGVSVAIALENQLAWACSYGQIRKGSANWVHNDTVFQAGSCSKPVAAVGFLRLVQDGVIGLGDDVSPKLGWTLPARSCAQTQWLSEVTLKLLLQHRGGVNGDGTTFPLDQCSGFTPKSGGGGYNGYADLPGVAVPTLLEILNGVSTTAGVMVNSPPTTLSYQPNSLHSYSGPGCEVMQQLLEHQRKTTLAAWMADNVFTQAGMANSTFSLTAPSFSGPPASGHDSKGDPIAGERDRYPQSAAAGLYTTAADLCRLLITINQQGTIDGQQILSATLATQMVQGALGWDYSKDPGTANAIYGKGGDNHGFLSTMSGYPEKKAARAIINNCDNGGGLNTEIKAALARIYDWPA
jgi:CubicO group peptidase (beta-lactamase class C family)